MPCNCPPKQPVASLYGQPVYGYANQGNQYLSRIGEDPTAPAAPPTPQQKDQTAIDNIAAGIKQVTPTLLIVGIATGAAFAIGSGIIQYYIFSPKKRGRK